MMVMCFVGCDSDSSDSQSKPSFGGSGFGNNVFSEEEFTNSNSTNNSTSKDNAELKAYVNSIMNQLESVGDAYLAQGIKLSYEVRGNSFCYVCRFMKEPSASLSEIKSRLKQELNSQEAYTQYKGVLSALKTEVSSTESVIIEYQNTDGSVIVSKEFK